MSTSIRTARRVVRKIGIPVADIPTFLCPGFLKTASLPGWYSNEQPRIVSQASQASQRRNITSKAPPAPNPLPAVRPPSLRRLPQQCAGCGALSQTVDNEGAGFYTLTRKSVKSFVEGSQDTGLSAEDQIVKEALKQAGSVAVNLNLGPSESPAKAIECPVCDRCHRLKHHEIGVSIQHPSVQSIQDTIFESPYKYNHVYHVLDAADFPMSLVPGLHKLLHLTPQRSLNRRSKTGKFYHGRKTEVSFIITRSDLLAATKDQVDSMIPYLRAVLRDALGKSGKDMRLGNVRCVSAKRDWWTKELKEEVWRRGGGGWMVGKVNVGKSQLFNSVFPKGRREKPFVKKAVLSASGVVDGVGEIALDKANEVPEEVIEGVVEEVEADLKISDETSEDAGLDPELQAAFDRFELSTSNPLNASSLLPPVPSEVDYPSMPLVSSLPGTTASPIRLSFGSGKGELIDLPGLSRGDLELHVQPEHRQSLVMRSRILPEQKSIKPGQSLLIGGFIRITPTTPDVIILAYAFTPIAPHLTATEKAIGTQAQTRESNVQNIALPGTGDKTASAGTFHLKWDVTRQRAGPITSPKALGIKPEKLAFRVLSTDILIEGCGWVELVAQVRKKPGEVLPVSEKPEDKDGAPEIEPQSETEIVDPDGPAVEVFTPEGRFISARRPMNAWLNVMKKPTKGKLQGRPRKAMKGAKKADKKKRAAL
ncbi:hypothetical protein QTJ16_004916 [Diplocarpon rosae]|uniref:Uncharacterized protein n=1 Tax=Diplocarpon rosae TaxID=946125 RepID=A0AAD9SYT1_9HELO|nr:hypothetical protein QTJ16_004916 [Diplocarpon rosae]